MGSTAVSRGAGIPMPLEAFRSFCRSLPGATEDVKWGQDLVFSVRGKMFAAVNLERPHQLSFKCSPETFAELTEREGLVPAPYLARAMWVQEKRIGETLARSEREALVRASYDLVVSRLPKKYRDRLALGATPRRKGVK